MLKENLPDPVTGSDKLTHLIMVAGHAVWAGCNFQDREKDENWVLESYQRGGSVKTFWKHIQKGYVRSPFFFFDSFLTECFLCQLLAGSRSQMPTLVLFLYSAGK